MTTSTAPVPRPAPLPDDLGVARRVLGQEAAALSALADGLGGEFPRAVDVLATATGRVVVTGMGKSGHVARKIAATLASTGTPALFVHPAEASHGDLGMITRGDAVIALSNSGDTPELAAVLTYCRRFRIPLVAMTSRSASALAEQADLVLLLPDVGEACPLGLAPTTSTTMMLALGDALAVSLLERRGFSAGDFRVFHPGGKLGAMLRTVGDLMHRLEEAPLVGESTLMPDAIRVMTERKLGVVGVTAADGALIGIVTDGDLRRNFEGLARKTAGEVMTRSPKSVTAETLAGDAARLMNDSRITVLFVVRDGRPEGVLHVHDVLSAGVV